MSLCPISSIGSPQKIGNNCLCIITLYDFARPLRLTYCTTISFLFLSLGSPAAQNWELAGILNYEGRRIERQNQSFPLLVGPCLGPGPELRTGSRRLIITYTQCARPRFCSCLFATCFLVFCFLYFLFYPRIGSLHSNCAQGVCQGFQPRWL